MEARVMLEAKRRRIRALQTAEDAILEGGYQGDVGRMVLEGPEIRLGDAVRVPPEDEDERFILFHVWMMLQTCRKKLEEELEEAEVAEIGS